MNNIIKYKGIIISTKSANYYQVIASILDNYNNIIKHGTLSEEDVNNLITIYKMTNCCDIITDKQKKQLLSKIELLMQLSGKSLDLLAKQEENNDKSNEYHKIISLLDKCLRKISRNNMLTNSENDLLHYIKKNINNFLLTDTQRREIMNRMQAVNSYFSKFESTNEKIKYENIINNISHNIDYLMAIYNEIIQNSVLLIEHRNYLLKKIEILGIDYNFNELLAYYEREQNPVVQKIIIQKKYLDKNLDSLINYIYINGNNAMVKEVLQKISLEQKKYLVDSVITKLLNDNISIKYLKTFYILLINYNKIVNDNNYNIIGNLLAKLENSETSELTDKIINLLRERIAYYQKSLEKDNIEFYIDYLKRDNDFTMGNLDLSLEELPIVQDKTIITIDDEYSKDLDTAFSIEKKDDFYVLEVYVADVPSILVKNKDLARYAYDKGTSYYHFDYKNNCNLSIDMLPSFLSHELLSLNKNGLKNVITFSFIISDEGEIVSRKIARNRIIINYALRPNDANLVVNDQLLSPIRDDLVLLKELRKKVCKKQDKKLLKIIRKDELVAITSILPNYYVGEVSNLVIYRDKGVYTKENKGYTHSVTPIRRIVSDINLILLLNGLNLLKVNDKDIHLIEDNFDEIIDHLNEIDKVRKYFDNHPVVLRKYFKNML